MFCAGLFLSLCLAQPERALAAAGYFSTMGEEYRNQAWTMDADSMTALVGGDVMEAKGNVLLRMGKDYLKADFARYFVSSRWVYLSGNVEVQMGDDKINASSAEFSLNDRTGWLTDGEIFLSGPHSHSYFSGKRIYKHWGDFYTFKQATVTTCNPKDPAWSLHADEAVVEVDGYAQLWGTSFHVANVPVVFSPYAIIPAKTERQSGFLTPEFGHSSMNGSYYNQPFFWAIDKSRDLTLNEYYMSKRGFMHGLNYRSRASEDERLWLRFDWLNDRMTVGRDGDDNDSYDNDGLRRTNEKRYWLRGMYDGRLPTAPLWRMRADFDYASDQYYLRDFTTGMSGFDRSRDTLFGDFSRDLQEVDQNRITQGMLFRDWQRASVYLLGAYSQDPTLGNGNRTHKSDQTVQKAPELNFFLQKGRILPNIPLEIAGRAQGSYLYRREGTRGSRFDVSPKLSLPINGKYGSLIATGSLYSTWYNSESHGYADSSRERIKDDASRVLPQLDMLASTELARVYKFGDMKNGEQAAGNASWGALKHSVIPRVQYKKLPYDDQTRNPHYDDYDRMEPINELVYSIENILTRRRDTQMVRKDENGKEESYITSDYLEVIRLRLEQAYDIRESKRDHDTGRYPRRPFRDILAELNFNYDEHVSLWTRTYWSPNDGDLTRHEHGITLNWLGRASFTTSLDFRNDVDPFYYDYYRDEAMTTWKNQINIYELGPLALRAYYDWSIEGDAENEKGLDVIYNHDCFQLIGRMSADDRDTSWSLMVNLTGFGN